MREKLWESEREKKRESLEREKAMKKKVEARVREWPSKENKKQRKASTMLAHQGKKTVPLA